MSAVAWWFEYFFVLPYLGIAMKIDIFSSPVATAGFSKFADVLSAVF